MFSNILDNINITLCEKTQKTTVGVVHYFPGGQYYTCYTHDPTNAYIYDLHNDQLIWESKNQSSSIIIPVSRNQFIKEEPEEEGYTLCLSKIHEGIVKFEEKDCKSYRRIQPRKIITNNYGSYEINGKTFYGHYYLNNMSPLNIEVTSLLNITPKSKHKILSVYDDVRQDLREIASFASLPGIYGDAFFEYYPDEYAFTYFTNGQYEVWDVRYTTNFVYHLNLPKLQSNYKYHLLTVAQTTFLECDCGLYYMHYLRPDCVRQFEPYDHYAQIMYNENLNTLDCYGENYRYRYKLDVKK